MTTTEAEDLDRLVEEAERARSEAAVKQQRAREAQREKERADAEAERARDEALAQAAYEIVKERGDWQRDCRRRIGDAWSEFVDAVRDGSDTIAAWKAYRAAVIAARVDHVEIPAAIREIENRPGKMLLDHYERVRRLHFKLNPRHNRLELTEYNSQLGEYIDHLSEAERAGVAVPPPPQHPGLIGKPVVRTRPAPDAKLAEPPKPWQVPIKQPPVRNPYVDGSPNVRNDYAQAINEAMQIVERDEAERAKAEWRKTVERRADKITKQTEADNTNGS